jgi:FMN phosphatase YigB (HAD superfamily)
MDDLLAGFASFVVRRVGPCDPERVIARYNEVRQAQYRVNLPHLRENDLVERVRLTLDETGREVGPELLGEAMEAYIACLVRALPLPESVPPVLHRLSRDYTLGVITNYPYSPGTRRLLAGSGLDRFFRTVVISADWGFVKPHPLLFREAARGLGVEPGALVHVGDDWEADVIGAARAGARSVYFTGLRDEPDPLRDNPEGRPLAVVDDLARLPEVLAGLGTGPPLPERQETRAVTGRPAASRR